MRGKLAIGAALVAAISGTAYAGKTLDTIKQRGELVCGVNTNLAGFSSADSQGNWTGLDVDICRAIAASILGDAKKVKWVPLNASQRFTALQSGEVDVLSRNTTWTLTRDASLGLEFTGITYFDGQGFMVPVKSKVTSDFPAGCSFLQLSKPAMPADAPAKPALTLPRNCLLVDLRIQTSHSVKLPK